MIQPVEIQLNVLFEEYRALYELVTFRMTALDRRVPVTAGTMVASLGALDLASRESQILIFASVPLALVWFVRATINHARSFEDVLRRIEEIEQTVNDLTGRPLLRFQSRHPSRGMETGGRTGRESVSTVLATSLLVLGTLLFRLHRSSVQHQIELQYGIFVALVGILNVLQAIYLGRYRYVPSLNIRGITY